jgi:hypothetical protein
MSTHAVTRRAQLIHDYERTMLIRAQAAKLLSDRGHAIEGQFSSGP